MNLLDGKTILIPGGTGEVGEGLVRQSLRAGATVIVPSRTPARLKALRDLLKDEATERLVTVEASVGTLAGAEALRELIADEHGPLDAVIASLGGWWQGKPLIDIDLDLWHRLIDDSLTAHFIVAKVFLPEIAARPGSSYTFINGGGALHPVPTAGPISVSAAGQVMLQQVFSAEMQSMPVRINTLILGTPVKTRSRPQVPPDWISADESGKYCVYLASAAAQSVSGERIIFDSAAKLPAEVAG